MPIAPTTTSQRPQRRWATGVRACLSTLVIVLLAMAAGSADAGASVRWQTTFNFAGGDGSDGWTTTDTTGGAYGFGPAGPLGSDQPGQWIYPTGNTTYTVGSGGTWSYRAPGRGAVMTAVYGPITRRDDTDHQFLRVALGPGPGPASNGGVTQDQTAFTTPPTVPTTYNGIVLTAPGSGLAWVNNSLLTSDCAGNPGGRHGCPPTIPPPATDPTDYPFLRVSSVTLTLTDPEPPTVTVAGQLPALAARGWTNTRASVPVLISASDPTSGVQTMAISDEHARQALSMPAGCDPTHHQPYAGRVCPPTATANLTFDVGAIGEGVHTLTASATDYSAQTSRPTHLTLRIDRTPPRMLPLHTTPRGHGARITWPPAIDRQSGTDHYETRTTPQGQPPTPWHDTRTRRLDIHTLTTQTLVEVRAVDQAGNLSGPQTVVVVPRPIVSPVLRPRHPRRPNRIPRRRHRTPNVSRTGCGTLQFATGPLPRGPGRPLACTAQANIRTIHRLAFALRPTLYLATQERWRPLNLDKLFNTERPVLCNLSDLKHVNCPLVATRPQDLLRFDFPGATLVLNQPEGRYDPTTFHSLDSHCLSYLHTAHTDALDCDDGGMYYHGAIVRLRDAPSVVLAKIDYWFFYRFNHAPFGAFLCSDKVGAVFIRHHTPKGICDEHQGDWEGISMSIPVTSNRVHLDLAKVQYAEHTDPPLQVSWRNTLCSDVPPSPATRAKLESPGTCVSAGRNPGRHPIVYVADGTHASYPRPCVPGNVPAFEIPFGVKCTQVRHPSTPEGDYLSETPWRGNGNPAGLLPFDEAGRWQFWPGNWNQNPSRVISSPGLQSRYVNTAHERDQRLVVQDASVRSTQQGGGAAPGCESWLDPQTQVFVCDPVALRKSDAQYRYGEPGSISISAPNVTGSEAFPGLSETEGDNLKAGDSGVIAGRSGPRTEVELHYLLGTTRYIARVFTDDFVHGASASFTVDARGVSLSFAGGRIIRLPVVSTFNFAAPAPPPLLLARQGRTSHGRLTVTSQTSMVRYYFIDRRRRRLGPAHTASVTPNVPMTLRVHIPRRAVLVVAVAIDPVYGVSYPYGQDVPPVPPRRAHRRHAKRKGRHVVHLLTPPK